MKKNKIHYYPPMPASGIYGNPYSSNFRSELSRYYDIIQSRKKFPFHLPVVLLYNAFRADVYLYNWIETFEYKNLPTFQYWIILLGFKIIKWRKKKIIWMFHNIVPHEGVNRYSKGIRNYMFGNADLIIAHSKEAADYARQFAKNQVVYKCHPITPFSKNNFYPSHKNKDILIWGNVQSYKGIPEFLVQLNNADLKLTCYVVGRCTDEKLEKRIKDQCNKYVSYNNVKVGFDELQKLIHESRFVLFPYIGNSISSSGALIDSIALGGNVVGPNVGAFKDLHEEEVCWTYNTYDELLQILQGNQIIKENVVYDFLERNSWASFVKDIYEMIKLL